jgi:hypothetical protein
MPTTKSAIQETRDQLLLDRADGKYLTVVSENIGVNRPIFGFANDDLWRAIVRELAFDYKQIVTVFRDLLTLIFGPQRILRTVLALDAEVDDEQITVSDQLNIPQLGEMVIDEGLATEETVEYIFRDPRNGLVDLYSALIQNHTALVDNVENFLSADAAAGATSITLEDASLFPDPATSGDYPVLIDSGKSGTRSGTGDSFALSGVVITLTDAAGLFTSDLVGKLIVIAGATSGTNDGTFLITSVPSSTTLTYVNASGVTEAFTGTWVVHNLNVEEVVVCTAKAGSVLTVSALVNDHIGPRASFVNTGVASLSPDQTLLFGDDVSDFPASGLLRAQEADGTPEEDVRFNDKDLTNNFFELDAPLANTYTTDAAITLLREGGKVQIAQVQVKSVDWEIFETEPNKLQIYLPEEVDENRLLDATFLHDSVVGAAPSTTVATAAEIGDKQLEVADASGFPKSGIIQIDAAGTPEEISYHRIDRFVAVVYLGDTSSVVVGAGGAGDSFTFAAGIVTFVDAAALFTAGDVGRSIRIDGATSPGNDGLFVILSFVGATTITYANAAGVTETFPGGGVFTVAGPKAPETDLYVSDAKPIQEAVDAGVTSLIVGYGTATEETVAINTAVAIDLETNKITVTPLSNSHSQGDLIYAGNPEVLYLMRELTAAHAAGSQTVALFRSEYAATDLEKGQIFTTDDHRFQGSYLWDVFSRLARFCGSWVSGACASALETTLDENLAGPTFMVCSSRAGDTALEIDDASLFRPTPDFQQVRVGRNLAGTETRQINDITLRRTVTSLTGTGTAGASSFTASAGGVLPEAKGYRLFLDDDGTGTGEEVVEVASVSGTTVNIVGTLQYDHTGDSVLLLADVLTVDTLEYEHAGQVSLAQKLRLVPGVGGDWASEAVIQHQDRVASVEEVREWIDVVDASVLDSTGGRVLLNFGREEVPYKSQIELNGTGDSFAFGASVVTLTDAAGLFTADLVGRKIRIVGALTPGNNGLFTIASYVGPTQITWNNASGAAELFVDKIQKVWAVDDTPPGNEFIDETADANSATSADFRPFDMTVAQAIDDYCAFGSVQPFGKLIFDYAGGTAGIGGVVAWEYWTGSAWAALTGVTDNTTSFTVAVADGLTVTWTVPADWAALSINGEFPLYYVRARMTTIYSNDPHPTLDQVFVEGSWFVDGRGAGAATLQVADGSGFPTASFWILIGENARNMESLLVDSRSGNILTLNASYATYFAHRAGEWIKYIPGELEEVTYDGTETGGANERITFNEGQEIKLLDRHLEGEPVMLSTAQALPSVTGEDYPFYLPSNWANRLEFLFDLARAAGVQVVIITDR